MSGSHHRFLFVTTTGRVNRPYLDPAARYRCFNPAMDLRRFGCTADVVSWQRFQEESIRNYDVFVFHKPSFTARLEAALALIEKRGKRAFADYDDLIFDEENALHSSIYKTGRADEDQAREIFRNNHRALRLFDGVLASTSALASEVSRSHASARVCTVHNGLDETWVRSTLLSCSPRATPQSIAYFCGTQSHDHDFAIVADVLAELMERRPQVRLTIVGPLDFDAARFPAPRTTVRKAVPYDELGPLIARAGVNIAPLEDNVFNRCKSGLKFFESAVYGVPAVATPIPDMVRFSDSHIRLPQTPAAWRDALEELLDEPERTRCGQADRDYAMQHCLSSTQTRKLLAVLGEDGSGADDAALFSAAE